MKNLTLKIIFLLTGFLFLTSCVLDQDEVNFGEGPVVVQFVKPAVVQNFEQKGTGEATPYNIEVQSFGGDNLPTTSPVTVTVAVAANSPAKEGVEVSIPNKTITIPAGATSANVLVNVNADKLTIGNNTDLILEIVSSSQTVSNGKQKIVATLQPICKTTLEGVYRYTTGSLGDITVEKIDVGIYTISRDAFFGSAYHFEISDNCGVLTIVSGALGAANQQTGTGTVNSTTGDITIIYSVKGTSVQNRTMILKKK